MLELRVSRQLHVTYNNCLILRSMEGIFIYGNRDVSEQSTFKSSELFPCQAMLFASPYTYIYIYIYMYTHTHTYTKYRCPWRHTGCGLHLRSPPISSNVALYQRSAHCMGLKVFSGLPSYVKDRQRDVEECKRRVTSRTLLQHLLHDTAAVMTGTYLSNKQVNFSYVPRNVIYSALLYIIIM